MRESLDVGIVGAGTAGSAAALFLARAGHRVTVYERVEDPRPVGAGIVLQPTGQAVLARLGLLAPILERGARIDRLRCETDARRTVVDIAYADVDARLFGLGLHRGVLFEVLFAAARAEPNVVMRLGVEIVASEEAGEGQVVIDASGERHGPHALVIVADGAGSRIEVPGVRRRVSSYRWGALWAVLPDPEQVYRGELYQVVKSARRMLGFLPTGAAPGDAARRVVSLYWSVRGDALEAWRAAGLAPWKEEILRYDPRAEAVLGAIDDVDQVLHASYRDVIMPRWHGERVVWLGDAGHAMSPQLGQGANLALWDAMTLGDALEVHPTARDALAAYSRGRRDHLGFYQLATRGLTPLFQSDSRALGWMRDLALPIGLAIPWVRRRMVRSMAGIERGIVRAAFPIEAVRGALGP
ncbi:MAG: FAD-dependent monooxygenase [Myxococcota bacterium]|nr:FAD-dependent monooxygenase [Myxococcota bacterium]